MLVMMCQHSSSASKVSVWSCSWDSQGTGPNLCARGSCMKSTRYDFVAIHSTSSGIFFFGWALQVLVGLDCLTSGNLNSWMCWEDSASWDPVPVGSCWHYSPVRVMPSFSPREFRSEKQWSFSLVRSRDPFCPLTKGRESNMVDFPNRGVYLQLHPNPRCRRTIPLGGRSLPLLTHHICLVLLGHSSSWEEHSVPCHPKLEQGLQMP